MSTGSVRTQLTEAQQTYLHELGLSADAFLLYDLLLQHKSLTAREAVTHSQRFASAQYRLFYQLESYGLARRLGGRPRQFVPVPLNLALPAALTIRRQELQQLLTASLHDIEGATAPSKVQLIIGREALYSEYIRLAERAQHEICIYAIGIAYSDALVAVQKSARKRGVRTRHAVQQFKPSNYHVLHTWGRLGVNVRLYPADRGFHVMLFDENWAVVSFSDPANTDDRISLSTNNPQAVRLFQGYFNEIWADAKEVSV